MYICIKACVLGLADRMLSFLLMDQKPAQKLSAFLLLNRPDLLWPPRPKHSGQAKQKTPGDPAKKWPCPGGRDWEPVFSLFIYQNNAANRPPRWNEIFPAIVTPNWVKTCDQFFLGDWTKTLWNAGPKHSENVGQNTLKNWLRILGKIGSENLENQCRKTKSLCQ